MADCPVTAASTADTPKISSGMVNGNISRATSIPARRAPSTRAAPTPPSKLKTGVPSAMLASKTGNASTCMFIKIAKSGAISNIGKPVVSQCEDKPVPTLPAHRCQQEWLSDPLS